MKTFAQYLTEAEQHQYRPQVGDTVGFEINQELLIEGTVIESVEGGVVLDLTAEAVSLLEAFEQTPRQQDWYGRKNRADQYTGKDREEYQNGWDEMQAQGEQKDYGTKPARKKQMDEAKYKGRTVKLGKPMKGDVRKFKVFVKNPKTGNVKKVNFGDPNMEIKRDDPKRRKNFRARHGCGTSRASDRTKAAYWSCKMWSSTPVHKIVKENADLFTGE